MKNAIALLLCSLLLCKVAIANDFAKARLDNWHQWRGPHANGASPNGNPPLKWDESTNVKWKVEIPGSGSSTPIVWGDKIFVTTAIETARKGKPVPEQPASQRFQSRPGQRPGSRSTQRSAQQPERAGSGGQASNPIPSPVAVDGVVYCMTGYRGYALNAIGLDSQGDITGSDKIVWHRQSGTLYVSSPLLADGLLYFVKSRNGILTCVKAESGEELYAEQRLDDVPAIYASISGAAGKVFVVGREGTTVVIKHGPELEILATNRLDEGIDASPVFVQNQLFLRGAKHLYCISEE